MMFVLCLVLPKHNGSFENKFHWGGGGGGGKGDFVYKGEGLYVVGGGQSGCGQGQGFC